MKRILLTLLVLLVVIAGAGWLYLDRVAQTVVERGGSQALGVPVRVESMALSPFSGRLDIEGLRVANPEGFSEQPLFRLDGGAVALRLGSLFEDVLEVSEVTLDGLNVRFERVDNSTNLDRIAGRLGGDGGGDNGSGESAGSGEPTRLRVGYLRIAGVGAEVDLGPELGERGRFSVQLPPLEIRNLGNDTDGITVAELVERITATVIDELQTAVAERVQGEVREEAEEAVERGKEKLEDRLREEAGKLLGE
ncbi:MAG: hypothetical protein WD382_00765 [Halofilum sp. (in: g-proteobacteria)]